MKYRPVLLFEALCFLCIIVFLYGCAAPISLEEHTRDLIARPLSELKEEMNRPDSYASKTGWKESTYPLANGDFVYIEPLRADCSVLWEINPGGTIIGYQSRGNGCPEGPGKGLDVTNGKTN